MAKTLIGIMLTSTLVSCGSSEEQTPVAAKQERLEAVVKKTPETTSFVVDAAGADIGFEMEAPLERQAGDVPSSAIRGTIDVDLEDFAKSTGLVEVDLGDVVIYQQARADASGEYGAREKSDLQNEHMKDWLEIGDDAPAEEAEKNRVIQFAVQDIESPSVTDIAAQSGAERTVTFVAVGELRLHQRVTKHRVEAQAIFQFDGDTAVTMRFAMLGPIRADLAEHDIHPRTAFGKLAAKTLDAMSPKVAKQAEITVAFTAKRSP